MTGRVWESEEGDALFPLVHRPERGCQREWGQGGRRRLLIGGWRRLEIGEQVVVGVIVWRSERDVDAVIEAHRAVMAMSTAG